VTAVVPVQEVARSRVARHARLPQWWARWAACRGRTAAFFPPPGERPPARQRREDEARELCRHCPVLIACRDWARSQGEYGFWGGETEEERAAAGFRVEFPVGRTAKILRDWRASRSSSEQRCFVDR
jgi:WhiB family transcriptional regulator, redox-sensing transcriptional regulator